MTIIEMNDNEDEFELMPVVNRDLADNADHKK